MAGSSDMPQGWVYHTLAELKRDKKKTALLCGLLVVGVIVGTRTIFNGSGPSSAGAGMAEGPSASGGTPSAEGTHAPMPAAPPKAASRAGAPRPLPARQELMRDPFAIRLDAFPMDQEPKAATAASAPSTGPSPEEITAIAVRAKAQSLSLQSTIISSSPKAIVNGQLVGVGDSIQGFRVVAVSGRSCVLDMDGVRVRLDMKDQ